MDQREEENVYMGEMTNSPEMWMEFECINLT